ncbi:MAG: sensor histidine kinase [Cyclobacteriaceae bacterium]|nr:sensor histidine kinase [Cyclobacteriaceae bacterium]
MPQIPFTVSARTAQLIGQQNFSSAEGAVIELVKNCYDADAKNAIVFFVKDKQDRKKDLLYIIDNGTGMSETTIRKNWMMIGTDNKENDFESVDGRIRTGAKGIGRFALDRLGEVAELYTVPTGKSNGSYWKVDWAGFQKKGAAIHQVKARLDSLKLTAFKQEVAELSRDFENLSAYLREIDLTSGTIIKISKLREEWSKDEIDKLYANLEILNPPLEQSTFTVSLYSNAYPKEYGQLASAFYDDFDYKIHASFLNDKSKTVKISVERNELDLNKVIKEYMDVFSMPLMKTPPFDFDTFKTKKFDYQITVNEILKGITDIKDNGLLDNIGKFSFTFYFLKLTKSDSKGESDVKKYPYREFNTASRRAWLKKFGGVKIFRDEFRVRPYGENGQDWLNLGERQAQSPQGAGQRIGAYRIGPNQISGTVNISRIANTKLQDKSGREGIQENDEFELLKSILKGIIAQFEKDRNVVMFSFSERFKRVNEEAETKRKAEEEAKRVLEHQKQSEAPSDSPNESTENNVTDSSERATTPTETEITLAKGIQAKDDEIEEKENEIRLLRSLSGTGLIVSSFAHELRGIRTLLVSRTDDLRVILEKLIDKKKVKLLPEEENPFDLLNYMRDQDVQIKHWLDYSLSALKKDKRTRTNLDIGSYFQSFQDNWDNALKRRKVSLSIINNLREPIQIRSFAIDFDTVFNNLLINSLDSFKRRRDSRARKVDVSFEEADGTLVIYFADNGAGLSPDYHRSPEEIFLPFETSKVDKKGNKIGTGIGMYLAKTIIDDYNGQIDIQEIHDGFKLKISIPTRKK